MHFCMYEVSFWFTFISRFFLQLIRWTTSAIPQLPQSILEDDLQLFFSLNPTRSPCFPLTFLPFFCRKSLSSGFQHSYGSNHHVQLDNSRIQWPVSDSQTVWHDSNLTPGPLSLFQQVRWMKVRRTALWWRFGSTDLHGPGSFPVTSKTFDRVKTYVKHGDVSPRNHGRDFSTTNMHTHHENIIRNDSLHLCAAERFPSTESIHSNVPKQSVPTNTTEQLLDHWVL